MCRCRLGSKKLLRGIGIMRQAVRQLGGAVAVIAIDVADQQFRVRNPACDAQTPKPAKKPTIAATMVRSIFAMSGSLYSRPFLSYPVATIFR